MITLTYLSDLYEMFYNNKFYEGYVFALKILMFDFAMIIPLIITLVIKNSMTLKIWAITIVVMQNFVLSMGFKMGAIYAVILGVMSVIIFILKYKKFNLNKSATSIN